MSRNRVWWMKQRLADGRQFCLSGRALGFDGKYYIATS